MDNPPNGTAANGTLLYGVLRDWMPYFKPMAVIEALVIVKWHECFLGSEIGQQIWI
jgi:hypothetical protein